MMMGNVYKLYHGGGEIDEFLRVIKWSLKLN